MFYNESFQFWNVGYFELQILFVVERFMLQIRILTHWSDWDSLS